MEDDGFAVHYSEVARGTPVIDSEGRPAGSVDRVVGIEPDRILDGIVVRATDGKRRFVDAPEVARTAQRAVTLTITSAQVEELPAESWWTGVLRGLGRR